MAQIFHRSTNLISRLSIFGGLFFIAALGAALYGIELSPYYTSVGKAPEQPVPFSHRHHVGELGIDCRYCHTSVEKSSFAGIPPTQTCMSCHSQIWTNAAMLEPVRSSYATDKSLEWIRVNALPEFVYFDHSIHISKGIGCTTCHGSIASMPLTYRAGTLYMSWCLNCHRAPQDYVRPRQEVFNPTYTPAEPQSVLGPRLLKEYKIRSLTYCSTCHR
jgi:hypothetical protein